MVFKNPDLQGLNVWEPDLGEWNNLVATWLQIPLSEVKVSAKHKDCDIIRGPMSRDRSEAIKQNQLPKQDSALQMVAASFEGCRALAKSLYAIIYVEH
jgi:hypothetical protein